MIANVVGTLVGILVGAYVTYRVARHYYEKASEELRQETERLRGYSLIVLRVLQAYRAGQGFSIRYDEQGEPVGVDYKITFTDHVPLGDQADVEIKPPNDEPR
jgi:hypothetical protein